METLTITNDEKQQQFNVTVDGGLTYLQYRFYKNDIALMHTFVPDTLGGRGIASALAKFAFDYAKEKNQRVMVYCPFVAAFLKKHPEYNVQVDKQYQPK